MTEPVEGLAQQREQVGGLLLARYRARREVAQISRGHNMPPTLSQRFAQFTRHAFPNCVDAIALAPVEKQIARVEKIVLPQERAFRSASSLDRRDDAAIIRREPRHHMGGL